MITMGIILFAAVIFTFYAMGWLATLYAGLNNCFELRVYFYIRPLSMLETVFLPVRTQTEISMIL